MADDLDPVAGDAAHAPKPETRQADLTPLPDLRDWRFSIDGEGIGWAVFDREGESANSLGRRPLEELGRIVEQVQAGAAAKTVRGLAILSGKPKSFIVGADIRDYVPMDKRSGAAR